MTNKKKRKIGSIPGWAERPRFGPGYGSGDFLSAPIWFETSELMNEVWAFDCPANHHASLMLRAWQWGNGPLEVGLLAKILQRSEDEMPQLIKSLVRNGWVIRGEHIVHRVTEQRRNEIIARVKKTKGRKQSRQESKRLRFQVLEASGFACRYCGRRAPVVELHVDHIVPLSKGGKDEFDNLVAACAECNMGKASRVIGDGEVRP